MIDARTPPANIPKLQLVRPRDVVSRTEKMGGLYNGSRHTAARCNTHRDLIRPNGPGGWRQAVLCLSAAWGAGAEGHPDAHSGGQA